ncbi:MAG: hypothetical protein ACF8MJ_12665 [Phycisphaerales bacterium JB050]
MNSLQAKQHVPQSGHQRRGTILILAIAVLAVLSLIAVSYVTVVRIDRDSSDAVAVSRDYDQQVGTVIRHMQSLIAADLFGNKVVTTAVPRYTGDGIPIWPSMFEDGDYADIDWIDPLYVRNNPAGEPTVSNGRVLEVTDNASRRIAHPDDAWLASTEPRWPTTGGFSGNPYFQNFTNLRSAFMWDSEDQRWVRGDGLYVDLAQWFLNPVDGRANAGIDLLDPEGTEVTDVRGPRYSQGEYVQQQDGIDYTLQMPQLTNDGDPTILFQADERFFADTTGDLRPDAQWTQLEELGNLFGLNWVVAARITDASALVNLNTAIEAPAYNLNPGSIGSRNYAEVVGTGETPADVDLVRLLTYDYGLSVPAGVFVNGPPSLNRILGDGAAFSNHLAEGRGLFSVLSGLQNQGTPGYRSELDPSRAGVGQQANDWGGLTQPLTRNQRRYLYEIAYSHPNGGYAQAMRYPERSLLDLHAFWGTNNATLISKPEQYLDGPEAGGYLPSSTNLSVNNGPLRTAEIDPSATRSYGVGANARPSLPQLEYDIRHLLTTVSGAGQFNPVPVINKDRLVNQYDGTYFREQHNLARIGSAEVSEIFADLVWALAPFATNKELMRPRTNTPLPVNQAATVNYHYGGDANGPAEGLATLFGDPMIGAAYALHRAGALAVNLIDAADASSNDRSFEQPTILRFFPTTEYPLQIPILPGYEQEFANGRFAHGDIEFDSNPISSRYLGEGFGGISFIGVDRQPFLVEAHTLAVYQSDTNNHVVTIDPGNPDHYVGSIIAFEIANPWPDPIQIGPIGGGTGGGEARGGYAVRIVRDQSWLEFEIPSTRVPAGGRAIVYWHSDPDVSGFDPILLSTIVDGWRSTVEDEANSGDYEVVFTEIEEGIDSINAKWQTGSGINPAIPFQEMATNFTGQTQVQLILKASNTLFGSNNPVAAPPAPERKADILVDRMTTISTSQNTGDGITALDFFGALRDPRSRTFETPDGMRANGNFRVTVLGNMNRPPRRPAPESGFPAYVVEKPELNRINVAGHTDNTGPGTSSTYIQTWLSSGDGGGTGPGAGGGSGDPGDPLVGALPISDLWEPGDAFRLGNDADRRIFPDLPSFQLFNPSAAFSSVSDVALVSAFCHMYLHEEAGYPNTGYSILRVNEGSTRYDSDVPGFNIGGDNQGRWLTFSEQLGMDFHLAGPQGSPAGRNPWFGKIDPTRYIFGSNLAAIPQLPNAMAVPLGSRIFDLFNTMNTQDFLVPGMVNINTAARRVLSLLPLTEPLTPVQGEGGGTLQATPSAFGGGATTSRAAKMFDYRERKGFFGTARDAIEQWTGLTGLRSVPASDNQSAPRGFVTKGEIPLIGQRDAAGLPVASAVGDFLEIGSSPANVTSGPPFETWSDTGLPLSFGSNPQKAYALPDYNPQLDAEEQLALFRSIANIVSTRSDVFMATFVLRGYDPDVIESIEVPGGTGGAAAIQAMNDPQFRPAYESRWLVVFDRSNVRQPTDRPRILLRMELPSAVP